MLFLLIVYREDISHIGQYTQNGTISVNCCKAGSKYTSFVLLKTACRIPMNALTLALFPWIYYIVGKWRLLARRTNKHFRCFSKGHMAVSTSTKCQLLFKSRANDPWRSRTSQQLVSTNTWNTTFHFAQPLGELLLAAESAVFSLQWNTLDMHSNTI